MYGNYDSDYGNQPTSPLGGGSEALYLPRKRRHVGRKIVAWLIVVAALLVGLDFGAKAFAENEAAIQFQKQGFPKKPTVLIAGFPFLAQVVTRHFDQITIKSGNFPAGPVTVSRLNVVADNVHLNSSFNGGTAGPLHGTITISLGELGKALSVAGPIASFLGGGTEGLKVVAVGGNEIKGSLNLAGGIVSASATWQVLNAGPHEIKLHLVSSSGLPSGLLSAADNVAIPLSALPAGLMLTGGLNTSAGGITAHVFADSLSFGS